MDRLKLNFKEKPTSTGIVGQNIYDIGGESKIRFVVNDADVANALVVKAKVHYQKEWSTLTTFTGSGTFVVNVATYDELQLELTSYNPSGNLEIICSSFDGASGSAIESIGVTTGDTITDATSLAFSSLDGSVIITGDNVAKTIDFSVNPAIAPVTSVNGQVGDVVLDKSSIGLSNVDNTSDADKPISDATQTALDGKVSKTGDSMTGDLTFDFSAGGDTITTQITSDTIQLDYNSTDGSSSRTTIASAIAVFDYTPDGISQNEIIIDAGSGNVSAFTANAPSIPSADAHLTTKKYVDDNKIDITEKGAPNGVAPLDATSKIDAIYLPAYVDDVVEYPNLAAFPPIGSSGIIYVALDTNLTYRWSGSTYIEISPSAVVSVNGKTGIVTLDKTDIGLSNVDNTSDLNKPISNATQTALNNKVEKSGDTMTGPLNMSALSENIQFSVYGLTASSGLEIRTDDETTENSGNIKLTTGNVSGSDNAGAVYLTGGNNVDGNPGNIVLTAGVSSGIGSDGVIILDAKGIVYLNQNPSGYVDAVNHRIQNVTDPSSAQDAATKNWVENLPVLTNILYVDSMGILAGADGSLFKPYTSIADALAVASNGCVIEVLPGTYTESQVIIPSSIQYITIKGASQGSVNVANGFSYTSSGSLNIDIAFQNLSISQLSIDVSTALNGLITVKQSTLSVDRSDNNSNVFLIISESIVTGGSCYSSTNFSECLILANVDIYSQLFIAENCKFISSVTLYGTATARILDCELFGPTEFLTGVVVGLDTPSLEIDTTSDATGGYTGTVNKILLAQIPLDNITQSSASLGQIPSWDGSKWTPTTISTTTSWGDITGTLANQTDLQNALDAKQDTITGAATTITSADLTASKALISDASGKVAVSTTTDTELGYVAGVTSSIQTQLNGKYNNPTGTTAEYIRGDGSIATFPSSIDTASRMVTTVFNKTGSVIPKFSVVYISGGQGDMPTIGLAQANTELNSTKTYGITAESISNMQSGLVVVAGALTGLDTDQFNPSAPVGDVNGTALWLSPTTPGGVTTTKPSAPNHMVFVGTIIRTHQTQGIVEVKVQNGFELEELHNVAINSGTLANNQVLKYESATSLWKNKYIGAATDIEESSFSLSNNQVAAADITGFAFSSAAVRSFEAEITIAVDAASDYYETFKLYGLNKGGNFDYYMSSMGDNSGVTLSVTSAGQVQYTSNSYAGFVSAVAKFKAKTLNF